MEEWIVTVAEFAEIAKLTCLVKMGITITFIKDRTPFTDTLLKMDKNKLMMSGIIDEKGLFMRRRQP